MRRRLRRTLNFTGRRTIPEKDISILVDAGSPPQVRLIWARLDPHRGEVPEEEWRTSRLVIEAMRARTSSFDRMEAGRVKEITAKASPVFTAPLPAFADPEGILFTLKVVSAADGRVLAEAEGVRPDTERAEAGRESLLKVKSVDLAETPWKLEIDSSYQTFLVVNNRLPGGEALIERDPLARALVVPAALRSVLRRLALDEDFRDSEWGQAWAKWAGRYSPSPMPDDDDEGAHERAEQWAEEVVSSFCRDIKMASTLVAALEIKEPAS